MIGACAQSQQLQSIRTIPWVGALPVKSVPAQLMYDFQVTVLLVCVMSRREAEVQQMSVGELQEMLADPKQVCCFVLSIDWHNLLMTQLCLMSCTSLRCLAYPTVQWGEQFKAIAIQ